MRETYEFLKKCGVFYLATIDNDKPRVRPFGAINIFDDKLYFQTGKIKNVSKQMHQNNHVEICGFSNGEWIRIETEVIFDERIEAKENMLDNNPELKRMYDAHDDNTEVFYLQNAQSTISSFTAENKIFKF